MTNHLRGISFPLGTKVPISLLPSNQETARPDNWNGLTVSTELRANYDVPTQNARGPDFYPRPNNPVRVRTAGAGPQRALAQLDPRQLPRIQQPVACSSRPPRGASTS